MKPILPVILAAFLLAPPALAASNISCSDIPRAESFLHKLKPGPNTKAAWDHLRAAKQAKNDKECVNELGAVNYYAKKSMAADRAAER